MIPRVRNFLVRLRRTIRPRNIPAVHSRIAANSKSPPPKVNHQPPLDPPPPEADLPLDPPPSADSSEVRDTWQAVSREKPVLSNIPLVMRDGGDADTGNIAIAVLERLGISILKRSAVDASMLFGIRQTVANDTSLSSMTLHAALNTDNRDSFVTQYNHLNGLGATDAMYIETIQHFLFPLDTVQNPTVQNPNRTSWCVQRWLGRPMSSKELWHDLPIFSSGTTASTTTTTKTTRPRLAIPDLSYWLSADRVIDRRLDQLAHLLSTNNGDFCPYLTVEFSREPQAWDEVHRMALAAGTALYNRFLLREAALVKQGISVVEEETEHIRHFGITFSRRARTFDVWLIEPNPPGSPSTEPPPPTTTATVSDGKTPPQSPRLTSFPKHPTRPKSKAKSKTAATATATATATTIWTMQKPEAKAGHDDGGSAPPTSAWRGCSVRSIYSGRCCHVHSMSTLVDWINEIHRWAVRVHAPAIVKDAEVYANHQLPSGQLITKPPAPALATGLTGSQALVLKEGPESGGHVEAAISENLWADA